MVGLVVGIVVVLAVVGAMWASAHMRHPEQTASHQDQHADSTSDRLYAHDTRPAGPDAEDPPTGATPSP
jgi:hypothetical protein